MATIWESTKKGNNDNTYTGTTLPSSSWSRQQKLAMIASFVILGVFLAVSACSKQTQKTADIGASGSGPNAPQSASAPQAPVPQNAAAAPANAQAPAKKAKKRAANVTYMDENSGLSFIYPRKFALVTGDKALPQVENEIVPMDFVNGGGQTIATVAMPKKLYAGTDFETGFFTVNVNRNVSAEECTRFAFVESRRSNDEPLAPESVKIGTTEMQMTDEFGGDAIKQAEARYYHNFENGACYEYVLGLGTAGYGLKDGIKPVDREKIFSSLEQILGSVKIASTTEAQTPAQQEPAQAPAGEQIASTDNSSK